MFEERRIWPLRDFYFPLSHTQTHAGSFGDCQLFGNSVQSISRAARGARQAPPEPSHCARSLSHWFQFSVCGQPPPPSLPTLLLPLHPFGRAAGSAAPGSGCATCGALIAPSGNRHPVFRFLEETEQACLTANSEKVKYWIC